MRWMILAVCVSLVVGFGAATVADNGVMKGEWLTLFDGEEMNGWGYTGGGGFNLNVEETCM